MQVAERNKRFFLQIGARSDALRSKNCNKYTFHMDIPNTVMVNAVGQALMRDNMVKGKKFFTLTADYIFGHDLLAAAKRFFAANDDIGAEPREVGLVDAAADLLVRREQNLDRAVRNLRVRGKEAHRVDDLGEAGLVVGAEEGSAVGGDDVFADLVLQRRVLGEADDLAWVGGQRDVAAAVVAMDLRLDAGAGRVGRGVHV